jgi:hypothetical protein
MLYRRYFIAGVRVAAVAMGLAVHSGHIFERFNSQNSIPLPLTRCASLGDGLALFALCGPTAMCGMSKHLEIPKYDNLPPDVLLDFEKCSQIPYNDTRSYPRERAIVALCYIRVGVCRIIRQTWSPSVGHCWMLIRLCLML